MPAGSPWPFGVQWIEKEDTFNMINGHWEDHRFTVAEGQVSEWRRVVDTALPSPDDISEPGRELRLETSSYTVRARSVVVLRRW